MWVFYFFAGLLVIQAVISLQGGVRYLSYFRRESGRVRPDFTPYATLLAPCRGLEQGLQENLRTLFQQDYPAYEIIFIIDDGQDPARAVIEELRREFAASSHVSSRIVIAGRAEGSGQKVHNLRVAVGLAEPKSEVFAFVDSDARPRRTWLRALIAPLGDDALGATTGYRWFVSEKGNFASRLRAVWNASIASALGPQRDKNFCWGGATAIRRKAFEGARVLAEWEGAVSDDFALMRALKRKRLPIHFVPECLTFTFGDCSFRDLVEFTTRQLKITRVYAKHFWQIVLFSNLLFVLIFFGGLALVITRAALGRTFIWPLIFILAIYLLGSLKAYWRLRAVWLALAPDSSKVRRDTLAHLAFWPFASALYLYNALAALFSRRINWRGITYELKSPQETVIITPARTRP